MVANTRKPSEELNTGSENKAEDISIVVAIVKKTIMYVQKQAATVLKVSNNPGITIYDPPPPPPT